MQNRPRARKKYVSGGAPKPSSSGGGYGGGRAGGGGTLIKLLLIAFLVFGGGGGALSGVLGPLLGMDGMQDYSTVIQGSNGVESGWLAQSNSGNLNTRVSSEARDKYTKLKGFGKDKATLMVYMCGTDLESRAGMATSDLNEMLAASTGEDLNVIVYTGGCARWKNTQVSSNANQIWQIKDGQFRCLEKNAGNSSMTDPGTLAGFIKWTAKNFPANRNQLILWDHGNGSAAGFGYDEKNRRSGSMTLNNIDKALKNGGVKFDFVGFDACLMATAETALMLDKHADYMIASEETEPGIGWYYTNWLNDFSANTSLETLQLGKRIADDFTEQCNRRCPGQQTTLSVVDVSELSQTFPDDFKKFAKDTSKMIKNGEHSKVSNARSSSKEFGRSARIDQIDLVHFAKKLNSEDLVTTILEAVKYNKTSGNIANAYGLSIYFPFRNAGKVDSVSKTYKDIGIDEEYTDCIKRFAQVGVSGQAISGGSQSPFEQLFGGGGGLSDYLSGGAAQNLIEGLFGGNRSVGDLGIEGLTDENADFMKEDLLDPEEVAAYVTDNRIDPEHFKWSVNSQGEKVIKLTEEEWKLVATVDMNMFYHNGKSYVDMGLDNVFEFDEEGNLLPDDDGTWLAINDQPVAYYHDETLEKGSGAYEITGHVPVLLNNKKAQLLLTFDNENEKGYVSGVRYDYDENETETVAKADSSLQPGDKIRFLYDTYSENGKKKEDVIMGNTMTINDPDNIDISNVSMGGGKTKITFKFTDIYGQEYWTEEL